MSALPLAVAVPLLGGAVLAAISSLRLRRTAEAVAVGTAATSALLCGWIAVASQGGWEVYWFGGWRPRGEVVLGIDFAADPIGAGAACLAGVLVTAALVFGAAYIHDLGQTLFQVLMLTVLAGMVGFALTGDLFDMFVFFELMSVPAFALVSYMNEEVGPLLGGVNFAVTNTLAAFLVLIGITLVYARTGSLNLARIGEALAGRGADGLVVVAFALIAAGFLTKAAAVPFHFWLVDAYAVAPAPVTIVFPGVLSEMGLLGLVRVYWTCFSGPLGAHADGVRAGLVGAGVLTAVLGVVMCLGEPHFKRLLAFATVGHIGMFMVGVGLLDREAITGAALWIAADGAVKAALFMLAGLLVRTVHGRAGDRSIWVAVLIGAGGVLLTAPPPSGAFAGKSLIERAADGVGYGWAPWFLTIVSALIGMAVIRAAVRIALAPAEAEEDAGAAGEPARGRPLRRATLLLPAGLLAASLLLGVAPGVEDAGTRAGALLADRPAYAAAVLEGRTPRAVEMSAPAASTRDLVLGAGSAATAVALAAVLARRRAARRPELVKRLHTDHVGDQVAWMLVGVAVLTALLAAAAAA